MMENFTIKDVAYIVGIVVTAVGTFYTTRHKIKELIRDKYDELTKQNTALKEDYTKQISDLKLELKDLKSKDDLQQLVINQMMKTNEEMIPKLLTALNSKNNGRK